MGFMLDLGERAIAMLISLVSLLKSLNRKALLVAGAIVAVAMLMFAAYWFGVQATKRDKPTNPSSSPLPSESTKGLDLAKFVGGLDLAKYCDSYGYSQVDTSFCTESINLNSACKWQFKRTDLSMSISKGPYSGRCVDRQKKNVGGVKDMAGYCRETYQASIGVQPVVIDNAWVCQAPINKDLSCGWQYQTENLKAVEQSRGIWVCFKP